MLTASRRRHKQRGFHTGNRNEKLTTTESPSDFSSVSSPASMATTRSEQQSKRKYRDSPFPASAHAVEPKNNTHAYAKPQPTLPQERLRSNFLHANMQLHPASFLPTSKIAAHKLLIPLGELDPRPKLLFSVSKPSRSSSEGRLTAAGWVSFASLVVATPAICNGHGHILFRNGFVDSLPR
jgi:hypothetical protein